MRATMWDDPSGSTSFRGGRSCASLLVLFLALLLAPASFPEASGGTAVLRAQEPESVERRGESPALQQLPQRDSAAADTAGSRDGPVPLHPEAEEAIGRLRSPWCPGFMLEVCPSPDAAAFRDSLRMLANQGVEADSLVEWTLARYGEEWRALPQARGTGLLAWIIPPAVLVLGAGIVIVVLRRLRKTSEGYRPGEAPELSDEEEERLQEALRELDWEGR